MDKKRFIYLVKRSFLFWLSRKIDYPLVEPDALQINFTFDCNLRCKMCSMHERLASFKAQNRPTEISVDVMKKLIKEGAEMKIPSLILIGGEPFLEPRIFELVSFARECGMDGVTVVTNGTLLSAPLIRKIFESRLPNLSLSIDAASEESFSKIRGVNVLNKVIKNIELLNEMKEKEASLFPNLCCVCTIMDQNLEELLDVVTLCRKLKISRIIFQPVVADNTDQAKVNFDSPVFVPENRLAILDKALDGLMAYKMSSRDNHDFIANTTNNLRMIKRYFRGKVRPRQAPCYAGFNRYQIVQEGRVYFCVNQDKYEAVYGDVAKDSLKSLWFSSQARFRRKLIRRCANPCLQWCSSREEFSKITQEWEKKRFFK